MWSNLLGFWVLGMPVCALLAFVAKLGVVGLWIGLVTGLSCSGRSVPTSEEYFIAE
jgi:Na+-driven multidrug efflux pump